MIDLPTVEGGFRVAVADPPWSFNDKGSRIAPDQPIGRPGPQVPELRHYQTMRTAEIAAMPVGRIMARDSYLALWAPDTHVLEDAALVLKYWGFRFLHFVPWLKARLEPARIYRGELIPARIVKQIGMGHTMRKAHEVCMLCAKGNPVVADHGVDSAIVQPRGRHSAKPEELQDKLERLSAGPYVELFARRQRAGWICWGDQAGA